MSNGADHELIADISRDVIAELAPEQLALFRPAKDAYFKDPDRLLKQQHQKDEMLGFGLGGTEEIIVPVALFVSGQFTRFLWEESKTVSKGFTAEVFKLWLVDRWRGRRKPPPDLTPEQIRRVRAMAVREAKKSGADEKLAERIAGVLAIRLAR